MRDMCKVEPDFPRVTLPEGATNWFCSLGNGHFTQALNLFRQQAPNKFTRTPFKVPASDTALARALEDGVASIVLRVDTPLEDRRRVAFLLNATHEYKWAVDASGALDISPQNCSLEHFTNFEAMSKTLDREALGNLISQELGVLGDGSIAAEGMRVRAIERSFYGDYEKGWVGVIEKLTVSDPVVRWDESGKETRADRGKLHYLDRDRQVASEQVLAGAVSKL
jgi:hypothetical protein